MLKIKRTFNSICSYDDHYVGSLLRRYRLWLCQIRGRFASAVRARAFPLAGLVALIWFLVRVIPKPSRAAYPCQRAAAPLASGFVMWFLSILASGVLLRKARQRFRETRLVAVVLSLTAAAVVLALPLLHTSSAAWKQSVSAQFIPTDPPNQPMGQGRGIHPGRVVWIRNSLATRWDGRSGYWWSDSQTDPVIVSDMLSQSIQALTGESTDRQAWVALFRHYNLTNDKGEEGYQPGERIAIKLNLNQVRNQFRAYSPGNASFNAPQLALALLRQLVNQAGVPDSMITFYDVTRLVPNAILTPCRAEFPHVRFVDWGGGPDLEKYKPDPDVLIHWSQELNLEIGGGNPTYLPSVVTQSDYLINMAHLRAHDVSGISGCAKNHFGSICASRDGQPYQLAPKAAGLHSYVAVHNFATSNPEWQFTARLPATYNPLVDLMGHRDLGEKTLLFIVDGLYATQTEDQAVNREQMWQSAPFDGSWTASLFLSQDGVAIDSVCLDFLRCEPTQTQVYGSVDSYLHEAALVNNPPSGMVYDPEGDGTPLSSLGVHEHWNNPVDKQYTGNLGLQGGIELVVPGKPTSVEENQDPAPYILMLQNYPNPFNATTTISYSLPARSRVTLSAYNATGQQVRTYALGIQNARHHVFIFDGSGLPSGLYLYRIENSTTTLTGRMLLMK